MSMISVEEAQALVLDATQTLGTEKVAFMDALGRVLAVDAVSDIDVAPFDNSGMDGFAVRAADVADAAEDNVVDLDIIAHIGAGDHFDGTIGAGQCARIMTGALIPDGADSIIKVEIVTTTGDGGVGETLHVSAPIAEGTSVRKAGEEVACGDVVVPAGEKLTPAGIGLLASTGNVEVEVYKQPRVGIVSNGSELVDPACAPQIGKIRDSNKYALAAEVMELGITPKLYPIAEDTPEAMRELFGQAAKECDVVITSGGACGGDFDYSAQIMGEHGRTLFERVNMRPGKAQSVTVGEGIYLFGLSGNPAAAMQGFRTLVKPALLKLMGHANPVAAPIRAKLACDISKRDPRRFYMMATLEQGEDGLDYVTPGKKQSSALLGTQFRSNCIVVFPEGETARSAGEFIDCFIL